MSKTYALASTLPLIFLLCRSQPTISLSQGTDVDVPALLKIKEQFSNPDALSAWQPGTDHCKWPYVSCNFNGDRRVSGLVFENLNLTSPIPPAIADLDGLQQLYITGTSVSGPVPDFLCRLTGLTDLVLYSNRLTGRIPECLAELQNVNYINLASNGLAGPIPRNLSAVPYWLVLSGNKLSGDASYLLGGGKNTALNLAGNKLRFDLTNVQIGGSMWLLSLSHNDIYGQVPVSLQKSNVVNLDLSYNKLSGDASFLFGRGSNLGVVHLAGNKLSFNLTNVVMPQMLSTLDLSHNCISGQVPVSLRDSWVQTLDLSYNELCGQIPTGGQMSQFGAQAYEHNKCLCGTPLPPCGSGR